MDKGKESYIKIKSYGKEEISITFHKTVQDDMKETLHDERFEVLVHKRVTGENELVVDKNKESVIRGKGRPR